MHRLSALVILLFVFASQSGLAEESTATVKELEGKKAEKTVKLVDVTLAGGAIQFKQPEAWKAPKAKRSRIIEREFAVPAVDGDKTDGRLTMMRSGGSVQANVNRWFTQFEQPNGKPTKDVAKVSEKKINGQTVTIVDISGTFAERMGGGPFAPGKTIKRENYRMLGGIVQTKASGQYFFKLYGPGKTIEAANKHFLAMLESVESVEKR